MTNVIDLVNETRSHLFAAWRPALNQLRASISATEDTFIAKYDLRGIVPGTTVAVGDELVHVWTTSPETLTFTVQRGVQGTTAASHAANAIMEVSPTFPKHAIKRALLQEVRSWPTSIFAVGTDTISVSDDYLSQGIALNLEDHYKLLQVQHQSDTSKMGYTRTWPDVGFWRYDRHPNQDDFPGATGALYVDEPVPDGKIKVVYSKPFDTSTWADDTDVEVVIGLSSHLLDIPPMGAAWRLQAQREVARSMTATAVDPRIAESVPPGSIIQGAFALKQLRDARLNEESRRLASKYQLGHGA